MERPLRLVGIDPERAYAAKEIKALKESAERDDDAPPVIRKIHKKGTAPDPLRGLFETTIGGKPAVVEYEPDPDLRDTEQVPLLEEGGIEAFLRREVLPHAADAWYVPDSVKIGYEISFTRYFYKPQPLRTLEEIRADILALESETEGLLEEIIGGRADESHRSQAPRLPQEVAAVRHPDLPAHLQLDRAGVPAALGRHPAHRAATTRSPPTSSARSSTSRRASTRSPASRRCSSSTASSA